MRRWSHRGPALTGCATAGTIPPIYLADAAVEALFLVALAAGAAAAPLET